MGTRRWRLTEVFRGPVQFGYDEDDSSRDITFYGATADAQAVFDTSEDEFYLEGLDLWLKDDDQLEFGDASDIVVDWDNTNSRLLYNIAAGKVEFNRNLTSGATSDAVVYIKNDNASDDQPALKLDSDASDTADVLDVNGWSNLGYIASSAFTGTPSTGSVRVLSHGGKLFLAAESGSATYKYVEFATTTTS